MFVNLPVLVGIIILAEPLVLTLFGEQWLPCVPILQVLGLGGLLWPMHVMNLNILIAQGRSDLNFRIEIFKKYLQSA
jgi:O-antigen/teichoic acid export membrane protein